MNIDDIKKEALSRLRELQHPDSYPEDAHYEADDILCQFLEALGHGDVVEEFEKIKKWYA